MPRISGIPGPYRFFFTSFDCNEPPHVPVEREDMNTAASNDPRIQEVRVTEEEIIAHLVDGRVISVPLAWPWRLSEATPAQRARFRLIGTGQGVHWPDVDEDLSVEGMLHGVLARRPNTRPASGISRTVRHGETSSKRVQPTRKKNLHG